MLPCLLMTKCKKLSSWSLTLFQGFRPWVCFWQSWFWQSGFWQSGPRVWVFSLVTAWELSESNLKCTWLPFHFIRYSSNGKKCQKRVRSNILYNFLSYLYKDSWSVSLDLSLFGPKSIETSQLCENNTKAVPLPGAVVMDAHMEFCDQVTRESLSFRKGDIATLELEIKKCFWKGNLSFHFEFYHF